MARDTRTLTDLAEASWQALLAVSAALPLPEDAVAGVVEIQASPREQHLMALPGTGVPQARVTHKVERTHGGMPGWALLGIGMDAAGRIRRYWPYRSEIDDQPFLTRFIVIRNPWFGIEITRIAMADDAREWPHDHSRTFRSLKFGWYSEWVYRDKDDLTDRVHIRHRRFGMHTLRYTEAHSITEVSPRLITALFTGRHRQKSNYWTPAGLQTTGMAVDQDPDGPGQEARG